MLPHVIVLTVSGGDIVSFICCIHVIRVASHRKGGDFSAIEVFISFELTGYS